MGGNPVAFRKNCVAPSWGERILRARSIFDVLPESVGKGEHEIGFGGFWGASIVQSREGATRSAELQMHANLNEDRYVDAAPHVFGMAGHSCVMSFRSLPAR